MLTSRGPRALIALVLTLAVAPSAGAVVMPTDFSADNMTPGQTFVAPTAIAFIPDGRMFVAEKGGRVYLVTNGVKPGTPVVDLRAEVLDKSDKGMLGIAVDPDWYRTHYLYLLYTVDPDSNNVETNPSGFGRLTRYTVGFVDSSVVVSSSRTILMGTSWNNAPIIGSNSHTIGALRWGRDSTLLVSAGDGAEFNFMDDGGNNPDLFATGHADPYYDIGAFRAQDLSSLNGKILRLDRLTGHGLPSNPFWDGIASSAHSRIWAYGLRNPFRFSVKPGTGSTDPGLGDPGTLYIQDVGWNSWEEINVAKVAGKNFGWPCFEGVEEDSAYQTATPAHSDCSTIGTAANPSIQSSPIVAMAHDDSASSIPPMIRSQCVTGGAWYTGTLYPTAYHNKYFYADWTFSYIRVLQTDINDALVSVTPFAGGMDGPVEMVEDPISKDLCYCAINVGQVRRIHYNGVITNNPPTVAVDATPIVGAKPLNVQFSSAGTADPDLDTLIYSWDFGDGGVSSSPNPSHVFTNSGTYAVALSVNDQHDHVVQDTILIMVTDTLTFPTTPVLDNFNRPNGSLGNGWVGDPGGLGIDTHELVLVAGSASASYPTVWPTGSQEAYFTFVNVDPNAFEENLTLCMQGLDWTSGHIEVNYQPHNNCLYVNTYSPSGGWAAPGGPYAVTFAAGDQLGARVYPNGGVQVFKNGSLLATASVRNWQFVGLGGRVGVTISGAVGSAWDNFGGGTAFANSAGVLPTTRGIALSSAWPNPVRAQTQFTLQLPTASRVTFELFDLMGRAVYSAPPREVGAGTCRLFWSGTRSDGSRAPAGIYLARVSAGGRVFNRRLVLLQ